MVLTLLTSACVPLPTTLYYLSRAVAYTYTMEYYRVQQHEHGGGEGSSRELPRREYPLRAVQVRTKRKDDTLFETKRFGLALTEFERNSTR